MRPATQAAPESRLPEGLRPSRHVPTQVTLYTILLAVLLSVTAYSDPVLVAAVISLAGGVLAWGWAGLLSLPSPRGTASVLWAATVICVLTTLYTSIDLSARQVRAEPLTWVPVAAAVSLLIAFFHQLGRQDGRPRVVESLSSNVLGIAAIISGCTIIPLSYASGGGNNLDLGGNPDLVAVCMLALAASSCLDTLDRIQPLRPWLVAMTMLVGGGVALGLAMGLDMPVYSTTLAGVVVAATSHAMRVVVRDHPTMTMPRPQMVAASLSVLVPGIVIFGVHELVLTIQR